MKNSLTLLTALLLAPLSGVHAADLKLASVFSDHMVLQREKPIAVTQSRDGRIQLITSKNHYVFNLAWIKAPAPAPKK